MSADLGSGPAGFIDNFAYGTLILGSNTYVKLVNQSVNSPGSTAEAVYANSLVIPSGSTLNLNGLNLYVRDLELSGTVLSPAGRSSRFRTAVPSRSISRRLATGPKGVRWTTGVFTIRVVIRSPSFLPPAGERVFTGRRCCSLNGRRCSFSMRPARSWPRQPAARLERSF